MGFNVETNNTRVCMTCQFWGGYREVVRADPYHSLRLACRVDSSSTRADCPIMREKRCASSRSCNNYRKWSMLP